MYAVIKTGGKQYRVEPGALLNVELLDGEAGESIQFPEVLLVSDGSSVKIGRPRVEGARVDAEIIGHQRGPKLIIFKKLRRHGKQLKKGHRQEQTVVRIKEIVAS